MLYLYGITGALALPETLPLGLEDGAVSMLPFDGIAAVTGELRQGLPEASEANLRRHFCVVEAFLAHGTVLPVRFGTAFAGLDGLRRHLGQAYDVYASDLLRLRGQVEINVRAERREVPALLPESEADPVPADAGPGMRYLAAKRILSARSLSRQREARELADMLIERLGAQASRVEWHPITSASDAAGVSIAFLLPAERLDAFEEAVAAIRSPEQSLDILASGPWPPYSFVSVPEASDAPSGIA